MASKKRPPAPAQSPILSPPDLAVRWGVTLRTLDRQRQAGTGPAFFYLNGRRGKVGYRLATVEAYERDNERRSTSDTLGASDKLAA